MQGTVLIVDGVSTNRIMLKVQLSAAYYRVVQADRLDGICETIARCSPDLIICAAQLPDGHASDLSALLRQKPGETAPLLVLTPQNDRQAQILALRAGADDVISQPIDDLLFQARIRRLIRARNQSRELHLRDNVDQMFGMADPMASFAGQSNIVVLTRDTSTGPLWRARLSAKLRYPARAVPTDDLHQILSEGYAPDAVVLGLGPRSEADLHLISDLRSNAATRHSVIIAVAPAGQTRLAAQALDLGADDVLQNGFCADELNLRLQTQLRHKAYSEQMRHSLRDNLRAAKRDPLTGAFNRRYALPYLERTAQQAAETRRNFAVMLADLDHFKQINDSYGHPAGDAVLIETARRMRDLIRPEDMLARVGGEEFLIVMRDLDMRAASQAAETLRTAINETPFVIEAARCAIPVTISIGAVIGPSSEITTKGPEAIARQLIENADQALYAAKGHGRNRVRLNISAA